MTVPRAVYSGLDEAASDLASTAGRPGIGGKRDVLYSLSCGLVNVSRAVQQIERTLSEAGYGPEVCDPVSATAAAIFTASVRAEEATHAVGSLMNMRIGDLPVSGRQVPHHTEISGGPPVSGSASPAKPLGNRIRDAYRSLAARPGDTVKISDLRRHLPGVPRAELDAELIRMYEEQDIDMTPQSNQRALTDEDRASAVRCGGQDKHRISVWKGL